MSIGLDVYDSEILQIERVLGILNQRAKSRRNYESFDKEIRERFAEIGFKVAVNWYDTNVAEVIMPEITIEDRIDRRVFDHDQQVHEVVSDILETGEGGVIRTDKETVKNFMRGHGHSH